MQRTGGRVAAETSRRGEYLLSGMRTTVGRLQYAGHQLQVTLGLSVGKAALLREHLGIPTDRLRGLYDRIQLRQRRSFTRNDDDASKMAVAGSASHGHAGLL